MTEFAVIEHRPAPASLSPAVPPWQALAEPALVFAHPSEVLRASDLSREQKRAVLASWASDAFAVESAPALRLCPTGGQPVRLADVLAALRTLDEEAPAPCAPALSRPSRPPKGSRRSFAPLARLRWLKGRRGARVN